MQQNWSATGFLALCAVLIAAIWIPNSHRSIPPVEEPTGSGFLRTSLTAGPDREGGPTVWRVQVRSAAKLDQLFADLNYRWPIGGQTAVPAVEVTALPLDLDELEVPDKKAVFFRTLLPLVLFERNRIHRQRASVIAWTHTQQPPTTEVLEIARQYRVDGDLEAPAIRQELLRRVDTIPVGLVLAQAANESGWGTSRFAVNANNLFGVWTFKRYAGIIPKAADSDSRHAVRAYPSLRRAVRSYFYNINVGHAYEQLRELRERMRRLEKPLDALQLAAGLVNYSSRGEAYVNEIRQMIRTNRLERLVGLTVAQIDTPPKLR